MLTIARAATVTAGNVVAHNEAMGWDIDDKGHALGMMLADLIVFAACYGISFDTELVSARETVADAYQGVDLRPIEGAEMPAPLPTRAMLDLSTSHISNATAQYLQHHRSSCYEKGDYGWFLHVADEAQESDPADLVAVLDFARARGFDWIMLDRDGDVVDGLPTFEW